MTSRIIIRSSSMSMTRQVETQQRGFPNCYKNRLFLVNPLCQPPGSPPPLSLMYPGMCWAIDSRQLPGWRSFYPVVLHYYASLPPAPRAVAAVKLQCIRWFEKNTQMDASLCVGSSSGRITNACLGRE
jgi:hypothetical protein